MHNKVSSFIKIVLPDGDDETWDDEGLQIKKETKMEEFIVGQAFAVIFLVIKNPSKRAKFIAACLKARNKLLEMFPLERYPIE